MGEKMTEEKKGLTVNGLALWEGMEKAPSGDYYFGIDRSGGINRTTPTVAERRKAGPMKNEKKEQTPPPWRWIAIGVHDKEAPHNYRNVPVKDLPEDQDNASHYLLMGPEHDIEKHWKGNVIEDGSACGEYGGIDPRSPDALLIESAADLKKENEAQRIMLSDLVESLLGIESRADVQEHIRTLERARKFVADTAKNRR